MCKNNLPLEVCIYRLEWRVDNFIVCSTPWVSTIENHRIHCKNCVRQYNTFSWIVGETLYICSIIVLYFMLNWILHHIFAFVTCSTCIWIFILLTLLADYRYMSPVAVLVDICFKVNFDQIVYGCRRIWNTATSYKCQKL